MSHNDHRLTEDVASDQVGWRAPRTELPEDRSLKPWRPTRRRLVGALILVLAVAVVLPPVAWAGWMQLGPRWLVERMMGKYASARSLQVAASLRDDLGGDPASDMPAALRRVLPFSLGFARPNLYYCRQGEGVGRIVTVVDGETAYLEVARVRTVYRCPAPPALPQPWPPLVGPPAAGVDTVGDPLALTRGTAQLPAGTRLAFGLDPRQPWLRQRAGPAGCWVITVRYPQREEVGALWIDRRTHLLRQVALSGPIVGRVISYNTTALDGNLPLASLRYQPPPDFALVQVPDLPSASAALIARLAGERSLGS
jgi:hypothetical protein